MKKLFLSFLIVFITISLVGCNNQRPTKELLQDISAVPEKKVDNSSDWVEYGTTQVGIHLYNKEKIKYKTNDIVQVWSKLTYTREGKEVLLQNIQRDTGSIPEGWNKVSHSIDLFDVNCKENVHRTLSRTIYDTDGRVLLDDPYKNQNWEDIVPDSILNDLKKEICK